MNIDSERPFDGQYHTFFGERGKTEIERIRFRDLADCIATAFVRVCDQDDSVEDCLENRAYPYSRLFSLETAGIDPIAFIQVVSCEVEKAMGVFPNIPKGIDESKPEIKTFSKKDLLDARSYWYMMGVWLDNAEKELTDA